MGAFDVRFETVRAREGKKWTNHGPDVLAAWVADMDFEPAPAILAAAQATLNRFDFGYNYMGGDDRLQAALVRWMHKQHGWDISQNPTMFFSDVLQGLVAFIELYSEPGDGIVLQTPIYPPFLEAVEGSGRRVVENPLRPAEQGYELDVDQLRSCIDDTTRIIMMASPHNPTGRVFTNAELAAIGEVAVEHNLLVLSDEIHADLIWEGTHTPFAAVDAAFAERCVTFTSATKSFNIAGLRMAAAIMGSDDIAARFATRHRFIWGGLNTIGAEATVAAWTDCDDWLDALRTHLRSNRQIVVDRINQMPGLSCRAPDATFLCWIDCTELIASGVTDRPFTFFLNNGVALNNGHTFGPRGSSHVRLNFATSEEILTQVLDRMAAAVS